MKVLACPVCDEVMHRVKEETERSRTAGIDQLARHNAEMHVIPSLERMLLYTAGMRTRGHSVEEISEMLKPECPSCGKPTEDSYLYIRLPQRTVLCCSKECMDKINAG